MIFQFTLGPPGTRFMVIADNYYNAFYEAEEIIRAALAEEWRPPRI